MRIAIIAIFSMTFLTCFSQESLIFRKIYKAKKEYYKNNPEGSWEYEGLIKLAKNKSYLLYKELKEKYPEIELNNTESFVLLEGFDVERTTYEFYLILDNRIYSVLENKINKTNIDEDKVAKDIMNNINNWNIIVSKGNNTRIIDDFIYMATHVVKDESRWIVKDIIVFDNY